jgi:hypothetical protein
LSTWQSTQEMTYFMNGMFSQLQVIRGE